MIKDVLHFFFGISDLQIHLIFMLENLLTACTAAVNDRKMFKVVQKRILSTLFVILFLKKEKKNNVDQQACRRSQHHRNCTGEHPRPISSLLKGLIRRKKKRKRQRVLPPDESLEQGRNPSRMLTYAIPVML